MTLTVVPYEDARREDWATAAAFFRDFADRFERGEISEAVLVYNNREDTCFESWGHFEDRWRLLGALEYAKSGVNSN